MFIRFQPIANRQKPLVACGDRQRKLGLTQRLRMTLTTRAIALVVTQ
jgi:hypothetical protein